MYSVPLLLNMPKLNKNYHMLLPPLRSMGLSPGKGINLLMDSFISIRNTIDVNFMNMFNALYAVFLIKKIKWRTL